MSSIDKKANSTMLVTISTGITFASDDYLITQGSLILQTVAILGTARPQAKNIYGTLVSKFLLTKLIFKLYFVKILMPQSCALQQVMNHLLVFFILMSCTGKWHVFYKQEVFFSTNMCQKCFGFHGKQNKNKKAGYIHTFSRDIIEISNC